MTRSADVLVLGGGLAGCRAALEAAQAGARVAMLTPAAPGRTGNSSRASGGFATALPPHDDWQAHCDDFLRGGYGINDRALVERVTLDAGAALEALAQLVDGFLLDGQGFELKQVPAHARPRSAQFALGMDRLMTSLGEQLVSRGVQVRTDLRPVTLLQDESGQVCGVATLNAANDRIDFHGRSVVLATGGCGDLFPVSSNAPGVAGEGYAMALRAGSRLRDMEFIQYTPTAFAAPAALRGQTIVGSLLSLPGVKLLNNRAERFMRDYDPEHLERADRARLARAIYREIEAGRGSDSGGVYLDISAVPANELNRHRPGFLEWLHRHGIDPASEPLQTAPSAHTCLGGVAVDDNLSAMAGLFVAGEALGGTHGANRLSSNSLTEANVTGGIAGRNAARHAQGADGSALSASALAAIRVAPVDTADLESLGVELRAIMGRSAGVEREAQSIESGIGQLAELAQRYASADGVSIAQNRILCCQAILHAAQRRTESRGCHSRVDHPETDDRNWLGNIVLTLDDGRLETVFQPV